MRQDSGGSVTHWIRQVKEGPESVAQNELWNRYFASLVAIARKKFGGMPTRDVDEEDIALSAFNSFLMRAHAGRFPELNDRTELWPLLVKITARKAGNEIRRQRTAKRTRDAEERVPNMEEIVGLEPTPEFVVQIRDNIEHLLYLLDDPLLRTIALLKLENHTNVEIADELGLSERAVYRKLDLIRTKWEEAFEV